MYLKFSLSTCIHQVIKKESNFDIKSVGDHVNGSRTFLIGKAQSFWKYISC